MEEQQKIPWVQGFDSLAKICCVGRQDISGHKKNILVKKSMDCPLNFVALPFPSHRTLLKDTGKDLGCLSPATLTLLSVLRLNWKHSLRFLL
jgi:hypothetical protein